MFLYGWLYAFGGNRDVMVADGGDAEGLDEEGDGDVGSTCE